jgi:hypothetical protein
LSRIGEPDGLAHQAEGSVLAIIASSPANFVSFYVLVQDVNIASCDLVHRI